MLLVLFYALMIVAELGITCTKEILLDKIRELAHISNHNFYCKEVKKLNA